MAQRQVKDQNFVGRAWFTETCSRPFAWETIEMPARCAILLLSCLLFCPDLARAENWPQWRGPDQNGVVRGTGFPTEWGEDRNIVWKVAIPGWGTSTPIVWEEKILMTCEDEQKNSLICLNRSGEKLWQVHFGRSTNAKNKKASGANPSPVTDGEFVYAYYKSGDLACVDLAGKVLWQLNLQQTYERDRHLWDLGTSPVLTKDLVVVAVMHQGPSFLIGFDKRTGKEVWKQTRDLGAPGEARDSYTTPLVLNDGGNQILVVLGADNIQVTWPRLAKCCGASGA
jgi:outer membrane protein assembly factor BamB